MSSSMLGEGCAKGLRRRHPEVCGSGEQWRRSTRRRKTPMHLEPLAILAQKLGEHRCVTAAKILEVEALGVDRIGDGSTEHGAILTRVQRLRDKAAGPPFGGPCPITTRPARAASVADRQTAQLGLRRRSPTAASTRSRCRLGPRESNWP
jgi:hypothetical protein